MTPDPVTVAERLSQCQPRAGILISICIPTLNRARYLKEALASLLPQSAGDIEVIVYDTGSTDDTQWLMSETAIAHPGVRYIRREEILGVDETLLLLLQESRGEYVWFFGSDDVVKPNAIEAIRRRIHGAPATPTMVYLNHGVVDMAGEPLIASQLAMARDRRYNKGWRAVPRLGLKLGYISACVVRREKLLLAATDAAEFAGSRWVSLHLYLSALRAGGPLEFVAEPLVQARRNPSACSEYAEVFVRQAARVFAAARRNGYPRLVIFRAMNSIVASQYLRFVISWRAENPAELARTFPVMFEVCWMYPAFWLVLVPVRLAPSWLVRSVRNVLRGWRQRRNQQQNSGDAMRGCAQNCAAVDSASASRVP